MVMTDFSEESIDLHRRHDLLTTASAAVSLLLRSDLAEERIRDVLLQFGQAAGVPRAYVWERQANEDGSTLLIRRDEWRADGSSIEPGLNVPPSTSLSPRIVSKLADRFRRGEVVTGAVGDVPGPFPSDGELTNNSFALAPVIVGGEWWGCLGIESDSPGREWSDVELEMLQLVADAYAARIERRRLEQERARIAAILRYSDDAIISKTLDGTITEWNSGAERIYGYAAHEIAGKSITTIFPADKQDEFDTIMDRLKAGAHIDHYETVRIHKEGREIFVSVSISPIRDSAGDITGAVTIARDITERKRAQQRIQESEERLRLALEAGEIGTWDWYVDTDEVVWSSNMERLHGLEPGSFGGTFAEYQEGIHPDDRELVLGTIQQTLHEQSEYQIEYRSLRADGSIHWLGAQGRVIRDNRGRPVRMTGVCFDITERKRVEQMQARLMRQLESAHAEADAERTRLQELFHHAPAMMARLEGPDHVFTLANDRYLQAIGYRDVIGKPVLMALPEVKEQGVVELLDEVYLTGKTIVRSELPVQIDIRGDGTLDQRYYSFAYQPIRAPSGTVTGVLVHAVDLTDHVRARKRVEQLAAVTASERDRLQQIIDVLPEGIALSDERGEIYLSNSAAREIWGQAPPDGGIDTYEVFGAYFPDGTPYPVQDLPLSRSVLRGETVLGEQLLIRHAETGQLNTVLVNSVPLRDSDGTITGGAAVFQDISSLKEFERQRDEFLQAVSHDLKNPLTTIQGYAQMLRKTFMEDSERSELAIGHIESATKRAIAMLDELLDLTRFQMGHPLELARVDMDLVQLAMRLAEQYETTSRSHEVRFMSSLPTLKGYWDEIRLERVLGNVLSNAIRYSPEGGLITIRVDREGDECDDDQCDDPGSPAGPGNRD
jgi:PAS domain S-box-containing protein